jgi:diketogulonate reductase-like aldo/keto reductase
MIFPGSVPVPIMADGRFPPRIQPGAPAPPVIHWYLAWVPFFPLGSAFRHPKVTEHPTVVAVAASLGAAPAQVSLAWQLTHYARTLLIPGTASPAHLDDNIAAGDVHLDPGTMEVLNGLAVAAA